MERRKFIRGAVGIGAAASVTGVGIGALAGGAAAGVTVNATPVDYTSVDGEVDAVLIDASGSINWSGFDSGVSSIDLDLEIKPASESNYETVATTSLTDLGDQQGAKQTGSSGVSFEFDRVDLTETGKFDDSDFESDTDGQTASQDVDVRVSATLNKEDESSESTQSSTRFTVNINNQAAQAGANTNANATVAFSGDVVDVDGNDLGKDAYLEFDFSRLSSDGIVVMTQYLDNYVEEISSGAPLNSPIAFDVEEDGSRDFQLGWLPGLNDPDTSYLNENNGSGWQDTNGLGFVNATVDGNTVTWEIEESLFGGLTSGDSFRAGGNATAGGSPNGEKVAFSDDDTESGFAPANMLTVIVP